MVIGQPVDPDACINRYTVNPNTNLSLPVGLFQHHECDEHLYWVKNDIIINVTSRINMTKDYDKDGNCTFILNITNVMVEDEGTYKLLNSDGDDECSYIITVTRPTPQSIETTTHQPIIEELQPTQSTIKIDDTHELILTITTHSIVVFNETQEVILTVTTQSTVKIDPQNIDDSTTQSLNVAIEPSKQPIVGSKPIVSEPLYDGPKPQHPIFTSVSIMLVSIAALLLTFVVMFMFATCIMRAIHVRSRKSNIVV